MGQRGASAALPGMTSAALHAESLGWLFGRLNQAYGALGWWPAQSRFEVVIGALLVQNTAWRNVEKAIERLHAQGWLTAEAIVALSQQELAQAIRPAGTFNIKASRLLNLCRWWQAQGGFEALDTCDTRVLRQALLEIKGVGPETADAILLYAFARPVFVIDAYTRRLLARLGWLRGKPAYEALRAVFERTLAQDAGFYGQYHALIVEHAKRHCRARPLCAGCPVQGRCDHLAQTK